MTLFWLYLHITTVILSIILFATRWLWKYYNGVRSNHFLLRHFPHLIDTLLLFSAIMLVIDLQQIPFVVLWITIKIFAVIIYIFLGFMTMRASNQRATLYWGLGAITVLIYIVLLAITKHPLLSFHPHV